MIALFLQKYCPFDCKCMPVAAESPMSGTSSNMIEHHIL